MDIICYEIGNLCYYVTGAQDRVLQKFTGAKKEKFIKKTCFTRGKFGEPIRNSEGALAIIYPEGKAPEKLIDPNAPPSDEVEEPEEVETVLSDPTEKSDALTSLLGEGGVHP